MSRSKDCTCLLCGINKSNATGSHMTPNCLLKKTIGGRNSYKAYSINSETTNIEEFFGSASSPTTEIKANPHTYDYVLCEKCEDYFGLLESEICPFLNEKIHLDKFKGNFVHANLENEVVVKSAKNINTGTLNLFIYSVVWRICLQQKLDGASSIGNGFEEMLSSTLSQYVTNSMNDLRKKEVDIPNPYILLTSIDYNEIEGSLINTNHDPSNPELFYVGNFAILMYKGNLNKTKSIASIPTCIFSDECFSDNSNSRIVFLTSQQWKIVNKVFFLRASKIFMESAVRKYANMKSLPYFIAKICLNSRAKKLSAESNISFAQAVKAIVM